MALEIFVAFVFGAIRLQLAFYVRVFRTPSSASQRGLNRAEGAGLKSDGTELLPVLSATCRCRDECVTRGEMNIRGYFWILSHLWVVLTSKSCLPLIPKNAFLLIKNM